MHSLNLSQMLWSECQTTPQNAHILMPGIKSGFYLDPLDIYKLEG